jgi:hypothetical protein
MIPEELGWLCRFPHQNIALLLQFGRLRCACCMFFAHQITLSIECIKNYNVYKISLNCRQNAAPRLYFATELA